MPFQGAGLGQVEKQGLFLYNLHNVQAVKQFLQQVGIEEANLNNFWAELRMFICGRLSSS